MVLKLDDLLAHLRSVREMATRLTALKDASRGGRRPGARRAAAAAGDRERPAPIGRGSVADAARAWRSDWRTIITSASS